jgi:ribosomal protein S27E
MCDCIYCQSASLDCVLSTIKEEARFSIVHGFFMQCDCPECRKSDRRIVYGQSEDD